jgi:phosphoribosylaminoimidazole-succinocarboxamide synthase
MTPSSLPPRALHAVDLPLPLLNRGKVREMYDAGPDALLMVATDRISAFDVVMSEPVPRKGEVLTQLTAWWLARLEGPEGQADPALRGLRHHGITADPDEIAARLPVLDTPELRARWARRSILVRRTSPLPVECVVRGYLSGSAWKEYRGQGTLAGEPLPTGLQEADQLAPPLFSPATKAVSGHDENIPFETVVETLGVDRAARLRAHALGLYALGHRTARAVGVILADTKFEFGELPDGSLVLIDEVLTPDSSRYWPEDGYRPGINPPSLDKQPVRDYLDTVPGWNHAPPPPPLPAPVVEAVTRRYLEIFERLTGMSLDAFTPPTFRAETPG